MSLEPAPLETSLGLLLRNARRRRIGLAVGAVVLALAFGGGIVGLSLGPPVPDGGPRGADQAAAVDTLLDSSSAGRLFLLDAIDDINACAVNGTTTANIRAAARQRMDLGDRARQLVVDDLPNGELIKSALLTAAQMSYDADRAYLRWVLDAGEDCPIHEDPAWAPVVEANAAADAAKQVFVAEWNPVGRRYGLPQRSLTII